MPITNRPAPVRLTNKSHFIIEAIKEANSAKFNRAKFIEDLLIDRAPMFSDIYDKENKK